MAVIQWLQDHWNALVYILVTLFDNIREALDTYYARLSQLYKDLYLSIWYLAYYYFGRLLNFVQDWYDKLSQLVVWWWDKIRVLVQDWWDRLSNFNGWWYARISTLVQDWWNKLANFNGWWYARISTLVQDWWDRLSNFNGWWYARISTLVQDWWDRLSLFNGWWFSRIQTIVQDWWDRLSNFNGWWYARIQTLVQDWWDKLANFNGWWYSRIQTIVQDLWDRLVQVLLTWYHQLEHLFSSLYAGLDDLIQHYYASITSFFQNPASVILAIIEAWALPFGEYLLATLLRSSDQPAPPRPRIGPGQAPHSTLTTETLTWPALNTTTIGPPYGEDHPGIDLELQSGEPILACMDGLVVATASSNEGYGNRIDLQGDHATWARYAHLELSLVATSQRVTQGQLIGTAGQTGNTPTPRLHFELKVNGRYVDPLTLLP